MVSIVLSLTIAEVQRAHEYCEAEARGRCEEHAGGQAGDVDLEEVESAGSFDHRVWVGVDCLTCPYLWGWGAVAHRGFGGVVGTV